MSIVRWGDNSGVRSDVYIIGSGPDCWECVGCSLPHNLAPADEFFKHLKLHRDRGDAVPDYVEGKIRYYDSLECNQL